MLPRLRPLPIFLCSALGILPCQGALAGEGRLQETAGVTQIEGSSGGGLVPWATLAGYSSRDETAASTFATRASVDDYRLYAFGAAVNIRNRLELSVARQTFDLTGTPFEINQDIFGAKARLHGDLIYGTSPQLSLGLHHKRLRDNTLADLLGADDSKHGTDIYLAASKAHLGALAGYNLAWDLTLRATRANQFGLLGYGGPDDDNYQLMAEGALALFLSRSFALGIEYRQKPDNLPGLEEEDAMDLFVAYIPNKQFNLTAAWVDLGTIAGSANQSGPYVSFTGYLW